MRTITIKNLMLQFDAADMPGDALVQSQAAVEQINEVLRCHPMSLGAQIMTSAIDATDVEVTGEDDTDPQWDVRIRATVEQTVRVQAPTEKEAIESAHEQFSVGDVHENEKYGEETISCKPVQA